MRRRSTAKLLLLVLGLGVLYFQSLLLVLYYWNLPTDTDTRNKIEELREQGASEFNFGKIFTKLGSLAIYAYDKYGDSTFRHGLNSYSNGSSTLLCETQSRFRKFTHCRARGVFYLPKDGSWHIFIPDLLQAEPLEIWTGIGKGSPSISLQLHHISKRTAWITKQSALNYSPDKSIPIITDTTSLVSVMHENLFRTLYAAAGVFYSLIKYNAISHSENTTILLLGDTEKNHFLSILSRIFSKVSFLQDHPIPVEFADLIIGNYSRSQIRILIYIQNRGN
jgi:hypothetical protein